MTPADLRAALATLLTEAMAQAETSSVMLDGFADAVNVATDALGRVPS